MYPGGQLFSLVMLFVAIMSVISAFLICIGFIILVLIRGRSEAGNQSPQRKVLIWLLPSLAVTLSIVAIVIAFSLYRENNRNRITDIPRVHNIMNNDDLTDILKAADSGDREAFAGKFSEYTRKQPGFEEEMDAFLASYPGNMSNIKTEDMRDLLMDYAEYNIDDGKSVTDRYKSIGGYCNDRWYYIFISYSDGVGSDEDYKGLNRIMILDEGARLNFKINGSVKTFKYMLCEIEYADPDSYRIIGNDPVLWNPKARSPVTEDQMKDIINNCEDYSDLTGKLGEPDALSEFRMNSEYLYYYEAPSVDGDPRYYCVRTSGTEAGGTIETCSVYGKGGKEISSLYPSSKAAYNMETPPKVEESFKLTLNENYTISRDKHPGFSNLTWHIEHNGVEILERNAKKEAVLSTGSQWFTGDQGTFTVYLMAFIDGGYVRVSNIIEYSKN